MMRCSVVGRSSRIPWVKGFESRAKLKWATYTFWYVVDPLLRRHFAYYKRKAQLDRILEKNSILTNCAIGVIAGLTLYFTLIRGFLLPPSEGAKEHTMKENSQEVFELMAVDTSKELPAFQLMKVKRKILGNLHAVIDVAEVRRREEEVEQFKSLLASIDADSPPKEIA